MTEMLQARPPIRSTVAFAVMAMMVVLTPAKAGDAGNSGVGDVLRNAVTGRFSAFQPLARIGNDAFRITYSAALGHSWSIELHRVGDDGANGEIVLYAPVNNGETFTSPDDRMRFVGWRALGMSRARYDALVAKIDAAMAESDPPPPPKSAAQPDELVVCSDGADYLTERRKQGRTTWLRLDTCYDADRGEDVARLVLAAFPELQCWLFPHDDGVACYPPPEPPDDDPPK